MKHHHQPRPVVVSGGQGIPSFQVRSPSTGAREIYLFPQDFLQFNFQCLRFVQIILALGSTSKP